MNRIANFVELQENIEEYEIPVFSPKADNLTQKIQREKEEKIRKLYCYQKAKIIEVKHL